MSDAKTRDKAYTCFGILGAGVGFLTLLELALGLEAFGLYLVVFFFLSVPLLLAMIALAVAGVSYGARQRPRDPVLLFLAIASVPYAIFGLNNLLWIYKPWIVANDLVEGISLFYAAVSVGVFFDWRFRRRQRALAP